MGAGRSWLLSLAPPPFSALRCSHGGGVSGDCYHVPMNFVIVIVCRALQRSLGSWDTPGRRETTLLSIVLSRILALLYIYCN
uniref:Putative secreted protein n=1 Tax=Anopheles triannulatus TaxID=58253 RepID=A0A2M4B1Q3_9DIPT